MDCRKMWMTRRRKFFQGVYRVAQMGRSRCSRRSDAPNGLAFLRRKNPLRRQQRSEESDLDGVPREGGRMLGAGRVFFDATAMQSGKKGLPDGMKVDRSGNLWARTGGVFIISHPRQHLGTSRRARRRRIAPGRRRSTLYVTADMYLCRVRRRRRERVGNSKVTVNSNQ